MEPGSSTGSPPASHRARPDRRTGPRCTCTSFGVDRLALDEREPAAGGPGRDGAQGFEMHLDSTFHRIPDGAVGESREIEIPVQLRIDARQNVEIERRRDALSVVIGRDQRFSVLGKIDTDNEGRAGSEQSPDSSLNRPAASSGREIADRRTGEEPDIRPAVGQDRQVSQPPRNHRPAGVTDQRPDNRGRSPPPRRSAPKGLISNGV